MKQIFAKINGALDATNKSDKHFDKFWFYNAAINEIPESVFGDISLDEISFYQGLNLTKIHSLAFGASLLTVKELTLD